jgi:hypothetical protein
MIAEREGETVKVERESPLIMVAKARIWASEGWQVVITDADGKSYAADEFEGLLAAWWSMRRGGRAAADASFDFRPYRIGIGGRTTTASASTSAWSMTCARDWYGGGGAAAGCGSGL